MEQNDKLRDCKGLKSYHRGILLWNTNETLPEEKPGNHQSHYDSFSWEHYYLYKYFCLSVLCKWKFWPAGQMWIASLIFHCWLMTLNFFQKMLGAPLVSWCFHFRVKWCKRKDLLCHALGFNITSLIRCIHLT